MSNTKLITVIGATGQQGSSVAKRFLSEPGWRVRGLTRNTTSTSAAALASSGVEVVAANLEDPASLRSAFAGSNAIFLVTDFWAFVQDPAVMAEAQKSGRPINEIAMDREIEHGKNAVDAAAAVLKSENKLERFVFSSLSDTKKWSKGKYDKNLHFDGKAEIAVYVANNQKDLAAVSSYVQVGFYMYNWKNFTTLGINQIGDGKFAVRLPKLPDGKKRAHQVPFVHPPNDTGEFVHALVVKQPAGKTMLGSSDFRHWQDWVDVWTKANGANCIVLEQEPEEWAKGIPAPFDSETLHSSMYVGEFGWAGGDETVELPWELGVDKSKLTTIESYIQSEDWSSLLKDDQSTAKVLPSHVE